MHSTVNIPEHGSVQSILLFRSTYVLKDKFTSYATCISDIYAKYALPPSRLSNSIKLIKTAMFPFVVQDILFTTKTLISHINAPSELFMFRYVNAAFQEEQNRRVSSEVYDYLIHPSTLRKYKEKYYNKRIYPEIQIKKANCCNASTCHNDNRKECIAIIDKEVSEFNELMKQKELFYVEMIPMVLADFIRVNNTYVVINLDDDNKELNEKLNTDFDKKIWSKIIENNTNNTSDPGHSHTKERPKELLPPAPQNDSSSASMISLLMLRKAHEQRKLETAVKHIFKHYSGKHKGTYKSFEEMFHKRDKLFLSEFGAFCSDFHLNLPPHKASEAFKKHSPDNKCISKSDFISLLKHISLYKHTQQIEQLHSKWLANIQNTSLLPDIQTQIAVLKSKTFAQIFDTFVSNDIGVDDNNTYLTKMKGYANTISNKGFKPVKEKYKYDFRTKAKAKDAKADDAYMKVAESADNKMPALSSANEDEEKVCDYNWSRIENLNVDELELSDKEKEMFSEVDNSDEGFEVFKNLHLHQIHNESSVTLEGKHLSKNRSNLSNVLITQVSSNHLRNSSNNNTGASGQKEYSIHTVEQTTFPSVQHKSLDEQAQIQSKPKCIYQQRQMLLPVINNNRSCANIYTKQNKHHARRIITDPNLLYGNMKVRSLPSIINSPIPVKRRANNVPKCIFRSQQLTNTFDKESKRVSSKTKQHKQQNNSLK